MSSDIKPYIKKKMWVHIKVKVATKNALFSLKVAPLCYILLVDVDVLIEESLDTKFCVYPKFFASASFVRTWSFVLGVKFCMNEECHVELNFCLVINFILDI